MMRTPEAQPCFKHGETLTALSTTSVSSDVVAELFLLGTLALLAEIQQKCHDAEGDDSTKTSNAKKNCQADSALLASLDHAALLAIVSRLAKAFTILTDTMKVAIVQIFAFSTLHASVPNIVDFWNAKLLSSWLGDVVFLVPRYVGMTHFHPFCSQTKILGLMYLCGSGLLVNFLETEHWCIAVQTSEALVTNALRSGTADALASLAVGAQVASKALTFTSGKALSMTSAFQR